MLSNQKMNGQPNRPKPLVNIIKIKRHARKAKALAVYDFKVKVQ